MIANASQNGSATKPSGNSLHIYDLISNGRGLPPSASFGYTLANRFDNRMGELDGE
jgi:hypothetical protein